MDKNRLLHFYQDVSTREAWREYLDLFLIQIGGEWAVEGKDTKGVADAKKIIDKAFEELDVQFKKPQKKNTQNEAR